MLTQFCTQKKQYWAPTLENFELLSPKIGVFHIFMKCENTWEREKTEEKKEGGREKEREEEEGGRGEGRGRRRKGGEKECSRLKKKRVRAALAPSADSEYLGLFCGMYSLLCGMGQSHSGLSVCMIRCVATHEGNQT